LLLAIMGALCAKPQPELAVPPPLKTTESECGMLPPGVPAAFRAQTAETSAQTAETTDGWIEIAPEHVRVRTSRAVEPLLDDMPAEVAPPPAPAAAASIPSDAMGDPPTLFAELTAEQRRLMGVAAGYYRDAGGVLDEYADVTVLRYLLWHDWRLERTKKQMRATIAWRRKVGADAIRRGFREGSLTLTRIPKVFELIQCVSPSLNHRTSLRGDLLQVMREGCALELDSLRRLSIWVSVACLLPGDRLRLAGRRPLLRADEGRGARRST
jgi:hypothetical protein